jgi:hypothetical protein
MGIRNSREEQRPRAINPDPRGPRGECSKEPASAATELVTSDLLTRLRKLVAESPIVDGPANRLPLADYPIVTVPKWSNLAP